MKKNILHIILSLVILLTTTNVYADGTKGDKKNNSKKENTENVVEKVKNAFDMELQLQNWMTNASEFTAEESFYEEELILENWMTEAGTFNEEMLPLDPGIELEHWMTEAFEIEKMEMSMNIEEWMLNPFPSSEKIIEKELVLEEWMLKF